MADIENDIDDTADKAEEIGKELGVEDNKPAEDVPDYDIQEISDERVAKEREPRAEKKERQQLSNKEKRDLRKKRISEKFGEKDAEIQRLAEENRQMREWKAQVDGRLASVDKAAVDKAWNDNIAAFNQAEKDHMDAFKDGDGEKATKAMRVMYDAQKNIDQLKGIKAQLEQSPRAEQAQQDNRPDPSVINKAKAWAERNSWYNPNGKDVDSEIAKVISGVLANEGFDPKSDDFWDELDDRIAERMPDKSAMADDEDEYEPVQKPVRKRAAPPVGGGASRGDVKGKVTISLPTAFINTLKDNGLWDDPKKRNSLIQRYIAGQKENRAN